MNRIIRELTLLIITALPFVYMAYIWSNLPEEVAIHFNFQGEADDWAKKTTLPFLMAGIGLGMYLMMLIIPFLDPKKKLGEMGSKYTSLRFIMTFFFAAINTFLLFSSLKGELAGTSFLFVLMGTMFAVLGNYFQAVRPNYFVGIRTPWTLQDEEVWKLTHRLGGRVWMIGGIIVALLALILQNSSITGILAACILTVMVLVPVIYSYLAFKKINRSES